MQVITRPLEITLTEREWNHIDQRAARAGADAAVIVAAAVSMEITRREHADQVRAEVNPTPIINESIPLPPPVPHQLPAGHPSPANRPRCINCGAPVIGERTSCGRPQCTAAVDGNKITTAEEGAARFGQLPDPRDEMNLVAAAGKGGVADDLDAEMI